MTKPPYSVFGLIAVTVLPLLIGALFPVHGLRFFACILILLNIYFCFRQGSGQALASPLFLFGSVVVIAFSVLPMSIYTFVIQPFYMDAAGAPKPELRFPSRLGIHQYFGSTAELLVLLTASSALAANIFFQRFIGSNIKFDRKEGSNFILFIAAGFSLLIVAIFALGLQKNLGSSFNTFYPILHGFLLFACTFTQRRSRSRTIVMIAMWGIFLSVCLFISSSKVVFFFLIAAISAELFKQKIASRFLIRGLIATSLGLMIIIPLSDYAFSRINTPASIEDKHIERILYLIFVKLELRQTETGYCLDQVIEKHRGDQHSLSEQFYWTQILIPRYFWKEKPSFSFGSYYAGAYCNNPRNPHHSAAITLLGQPFIHGGFIGVGGTVLFYITFLVTLTWIASKGPPLATAAVFALTPWWLDFEQDFVMFIGNFAKMGLAVLLMSMALAALALVLQHKSSRVHR